MGHAASTGRAAWMPLVNGKWWIEGREDPSKAGYEPPVQTVAGTLNDGDTGWWTLGAIGGARGQSPQSPRREE